MRMLLDKLSVVLVEPGWILGSCNTDAGIPLDCWLSCMWYSLVRFAVRPHSRFWWQDSYGPQRKEQLQNEMSMYRCHTIFNCTLLQSLCVSHITNIHCSPKAHVLALRVLTLQKPSRRSSSSLQLTKVQTALRDTKPRWDGTHMWIAS